MAHEISEMAHEKWLTRFSNGSRDFRYELDLHHHRVFLFATNNVSLKILIYSPSRLKKFLDVVVPANEIASRFFNQIQAKIVDIGVRKAYILTNILSTKLPGYDFSIFRQLTRLD